jgi:hypothetical protein
MRAIKLRPRLPRLVIIALTLIISAVAIIYAEQLRTDNEFNAALSAYLSDAILHDVHDWGAGQHILVVAQLEPQRLGTWKSTLFYPADRRHGFVSSSPLTRWSFAVSNILPRHLHWSLSLPSGVEFASAVQDDLARTSFKDFQAKFPNNLGYVAVSRAGLNLQRTEIIFYIDHFCGLCGGGRYVLMRKINGGWKTIDEHYTWIS